MMEPLSVGIHSVSTLGKCKSNQVVIVFGAGPVGLLCMAVAKALGARRVIAVDIQKERLDFAKGYAADDIFIPVSAPFLSLDGCCSLLGSDLASGEGAVVVQSTPARQI
jgi:threonine dehydrogenase-like Zn-dependent dehydrogenase